MPLPDLLVSFLAAALVSLVLCALKIAFDSMAATPPGSTLLLHRPSSLASSTASSPPPSSSLSASSSPLAATKSKARRRKGLKVSFEESGDAGAQARRDDDARVSPASGGWVAAGREGLVLRRGVGRKLSVVLEE